MTNEKEVSEKSIAKIEMAIEELKSSPKAKTKSTQAEIKQLKSALSKVYIEYKKKAMNFEGKNLSHLLFLRSTNGFYKILGNSLLFYAFEIAPKLGMEARIYSDGDYEAKSEDGVISLRSLDSVVSGITKLGAKQAKTRDKTGNIIIYKLPWEYTSDQIEKYRGQSTYKLQKYNHIIMVENVIPVLLFHIDDLLKAIYENVRRMEPVARETLGDMMVILAAEMKRIYIEMANGRISLEQGLNAMMTRVNKLKSQIKIVVDLKIWNARIYARIGDILIKIQDVIEMEKKAEQR